MKNLLNIFDALDKKYFSDAKQLQRIVILTAVVLVLAVGSFAGYYWYDRYYQPQPKIQEVSISNAEQAVRDNPENIDARVNLANSYMIAGRWNDAIDQISEAQKVKPDDIRLSFLLGVSYANTSRCEEAIPLLKKFTDSLKDADMLNLNPQYQAGLYYQGDCYLQLKKPQDAIAPLALDVKLSQTDADAIYKLGLALAGTNKYNEAILAYEKAVSFVPDYTQVYASMADAYKALGKTSETNYANAMVSYSNKDYDSAYPVLLQVTKDLPAFEPGFTGLGLTCEAKKDMPCALTAYTMANKLQPDDFTASQGVLRVQAGLKK
jgi:tetratricopeptide (TPR) repeat protein